MGQGSTTDIGITVPEGWSVATDGKRISVDVKTKDFLAAVALINDVAQIAEGLDHHPDLHLTGWNKVRIETYSHDVGKLTERDEKLAAQIQAILEKGNIRPAAPPA